MAEKKVSGPRLAAYAMPGIPEAMILYCAAMVIPGFFTTEVGLSTAFVAMVYTVSRLFDAVTDIGIGYLSDRTNSPLGRRKPWLIAGTILSTIAVFYLYHPAAENPGTRYAVATFALYLGWTMAIVPYDAWGAEISNDHALRNRIFTFRAIAYFTGSLMFLATPLLPMFSGNFDREVLHYSAYLVGGSFIVATTIAIVFAPKEDNRLKTATPTLRGMLKTLLTNRPLQYYVAVFLLSGLSLGISLALVYVYVNTYLMLDGKFASILFFYVLANLVAVPFWYLVLKKVDKHKAWAIGVFIQGICYPPLVFLTPDNPHAYIILLSVVCTAGAAYAVIDIVMKSLLSDVIDHDTLQSGENHSASIFAISALMRKLNIAFGGGFAFMMLSWFGYEPSETTHSPTSVLYGLKFTYLIFPAFLSTAGALMLWRFPIDRKRHEIILQQLAERAK